MNLTLLTQDKFNITGRGTVYTISLKENGIDRSKLSETLMDKNVNINGEDFLVRGIETAGVSDTIGVLVRELNKPKYNRIQIRELKAFRDFYSSPTSDYFKMFIGKPSPTDNTIALEVKTDYGSEIYIPDENGYITVHIKPQMIKKD